ncbi:MAG: family 78 glycoside hydrolase catalytic domain [Ruminococcus sp.]|nr:family 78 glycoside hydrolase catalytic domain [Candidatus Copronaster equi]
MTHKELFGDAQWVCMGKPCDAALFRSTFENKNSDKAEIIICGLGYFKLYINGRRVGNDEFVPANSDYHDRADMTLNYPLSDERTFTIYCMKYDIKKYLTEGENVIGVAVGSGFYHQIIRQAEGNTSFGNIKLCYKIILDDKEILSDCKKIKCQTGFFKKENLFHGEMLDYTNFDRKWNTAEADENGWENTFSVNAPKSNYLIQNCPTDKVIEILKPELVKNFGDYSVYKIEKNISGYPVVRCKKSGEKIELECAEEIFADGNTDNTSVGYGHQRQRMTYITDSEEIYHPHFCWFGFRYFSLTNNAEPVEIRVIHSDIKVTSDFECSDETLNWYYKAYINTQLSNMHGCVPSDCPHRERLGYTGDGQLTCDVVMTELDTEVFYRKWIRDIVDCQDKNTGHVQHTAPFGGGGGGPVGWGGAIIKVPYIYYRHFGNKSELENIFPRMDLFVDYIENRCENGLIVREEKDGWCLGDWCTPENIKIPEEYVNTTMFISQLKMMIFCAKTLGKDCKKYEALIDSHSRAIKEKYFDETSGDFFNDINGANSFAIDCGIAEEKTLENTVKKYSNLMQFDTGIFGTDILLNTLYSSGNGNLATALLANKNEVSFEFMRKNGATTIWENWNGEASHSHPMFGASTLYLFSRVLGIRQTENSVCFDSVTIEPVFADCLNFAKGFITTPHGKISVDWKRNNDKIIVEIELCENVKAKFKNNEKTVVLSAGKNKVII